jgi:hypothetical protein
MTTNTLMGTVVHASLTFEGPHVVVRLSSGEAIYAVGELASQLQSALSQQEDRYGRPLLTRTVITDGDGKLNVQSFTLDAGNGAA